MHLSKLMSLALMAATLPFSSLCWAQQSSPVPAGGTVTGHVTCSDTQRPARFATVVLFGLPTEITPMAKAGVDSQSMKATAESVFKAMGSANMTQTQTDVDGAFTAANVAPGDYYVFADVPGYVEPRSVLQAAYEGGADLTKPVPGIPVVHVVAERPSQVNISVDRGAAISGRVLWDDGSPVTHAMVTVVSAKGKQKELPQQFAMMGMGAGIGGLLAVSDDLGNYRIAGLAPGDYFVKGSLQTNSQFAIRSGVMNMKGLMVNSPLVVYAPAAFHQADAKPLTLHAGEERGDEELTLSLGGMHSVSGRVASAEDHHGINSGTVSLEDAKDKEFSRAAPLDGNGNFTVTFVPPGTYNLLVTNAGDTEPSTKKSTGLIKVLSETTLRSYQDGKQTVIVTDSDVTGQNIELAPAKKVKEDPDENDPIE